MVDMSDELVQWLGEQLDEDERIARAATAGPWNRMGRRVLDPTPPSDRLGVGMAVGHAAADADFNETAEHIATHDPARVLREIDAKRQVLTSYIKLVEQVKELSAIRDRLSTQGRNTVITDGELESAIHRRDALLGVLRLLALPYAARPGYREEWRP